MTSIGRSAAIRVESLCLRLDTGEPVVEDVSFDVAPGEILGVVGESGSGKTTVALALLGYMRPGVNLRRDVQSSFQGLPLAAVAAFELKVIHLSELDPMILRASCRRAIEDLKAKPPSISCGRWCWRCSASGCS